MISKSTVLVAVVAMATTGASAQRCEDCGPYPIGRKMLQSASEGTASSPSPPAPSPPVPSPPAPSPPAPSPSVPSPPAPSMAGPSALPPFFMENNIIKCPNATVGDTGVVNGVTYTKRDRNGLDVLVAKGSSQWPQLSTSCTSGVVDMSALWVLTSPAVRSPAPTRSRSLRAPLARQVLQRVRRRQGPQRAHQ